MLLNHTYTITKAGGRRTQRPVSFSFGLQKEERMKTSKKVKRNYKDTVSRMLFRKPENALSLYNALNGTDYTDSTQITFNMLENAIYMGMHNDISFLIMNETNLYEHQSTYNLNMPLRDLFYIAELLQVYVKDESLYSSKLIKLPTPHFVVFYNVMSPKKTKRLQSRHLVFMAH